MQPSLGTMRLAVTSLACCLALGLSACGDDGPAVSDAAVAKAEKQLLDGGLEAYEKRIESLAGTPIVVNKWASWCTPCRQEFPMFARQARRLEGKVAFIGVNAKDPGDAAARFLAQSPVPYDSYRDPDQKIARSFRGDRFFPTTAFYNRDGVIVDIHQGGYQKEKDLVADLRRYAR